MFYHCVQCFMLIYNASFRIFYSFMERGEDWSGGRFRDAIIYYEIPKILCEFVASKSCCWMSTIHTDLRGLWAHVAMGVDVGTSPQGRSCPVTHKITKYTEPVSSAAQIINFCSTSHLTAFRVITRCCSDSANWIMREVIALLACADGRDNITENICQKSFIIKRSSYRRVHVFDTWIRAIWKENWAFVCLLMCMNNPTILNLKWQTTAYVLNFTDFYIFRNASTEFFFTLFATVAELVQSLVFIIIVHFKRSGRLSYKRKLFCFIVPNLQ